MISVVLLIYSIMFLHVLPQRGAKYEGFALWHRFQVSPGALYDVVHPANAAGRTFMGRHHVKQTQWVSIKMVGKTWLLMVIDLMVIDLMIIPNVYLGVSENRVNPEKPNGFADHDPVMKNGYF